MEKKKKKKKKKLDYKTKMLKVQKKTRLYA
jgi:hypothetical protein